MREYRHGSRTTVRGAAPALATTARNEQLDLALASEVSARHISFLELRFLTTMTSFTAPQYVTVEELRIESYFSLDEETIRTCERLARD